MGEPEVLSHRKGRRVVKDNPWVRRPRSESPPEDLQEELEAAPAPSRRVEAIPQPGIVLPRPEDRFPVRVVPDATAGVVWWVGAHGGAGESTLEQLLEGSCAAGHAWPMHGSAGEVSPCRAVVVARTNAGGLRAAQRVVAEWASGEVPVDLIGLVLVADAPGRLPRPLKDFVQLLAGGVPAVWHIPWVEAWRTTHTVSAQTAPRPVRGVIDDLRTHQTTQQEEPADARRSP